MFLVGDLKKLFLSFLLVGLITIIASYFASSILLYTCGMIYIIISGIIAIIISHKLRVTEEEESQETDTPSSFLTDSFTSEEIEQMRERINRDIQEMIDRYG